MTFLFHEGSFQLSARIRIQDKLKATPSFGDKTLVGRLYV
jgi:hypothetical protein